MANQALIQAAQRMYTAKAQKADIAPVLDAAASSIVNINEAIAEKRKQQKIESEKEVRLPFLETLKNNPNARPELVDELNRTQDQYFDALRRSENVFLSKKKRQQAAEELNVIQSELIGLQKSLAGVDLKRAETPRGQISDWNNTVESAEDVAFHDGELLSKNIIIKDRVAYLKTAAYKENQSFESNISDKGIIKLDDYNPAMTKHEEAFTSMADSAVEVELLSLEKGFVFEGSTLEKKLKNDIQKFLDDSNGASLFADTIGGEFNWLGQQLLDDREGFKNPGVVRKEDGTIEITDPLAYNNNKEILKERVKNNRKFYDKEFMNDYLRSLRMISNEGVKKYEAKQEEANMRTGEEKPYNTTVGYYDKQGLRSLISNVYKTEEDAKNNPPIVFSKEKQYRKFEDGRFYQLDANDGKLNKDALGFTEDQMLSMLRVDGYLDMFDFGTETQGQESSGYDERLIPGLNPELEAALEKYPGYASDSTFMDSGLYQDYTEGKLDTLLNDYVEMRLNQSQQAAMTPAEGSDLDNIANDIASEQKSSKGDARIIDVRYGPLKTTKLAGRAKGDKVLTLVGITEKEYLQYKELPTFGGTVEQNKLRKKIKDAIEKARKVAENKK